MTQVWRGIHKVTEECGELLQILGKLGPYPDGVHPDGKGDLRTRLQLEIGDLLAALSYFCEAADLDQAAIQAQHDTKLAKFFRWQLTGIPSDQEPQA